MVTETKTEDLLVLNPSVQIIRSTDDEVVVRFGSRGRSSQRINDGKRRGVLSDVVFAFAGGAPSSDVVAAHGPAAQDIVDDLRSRGILLAEADQRFGFLTAGYGSSEVSVSSLAVVGEGALTQHCARFLSDALAGRVEVARVPALAPQDEPAEFLVCVADAPSLGFFYDVNEYALTHGVAWHGGYLDGPELVAGPLFRPGVTGCYHDFDVMDEAGRSMKIDHLFMKLNGGPAEPAAVPEFVGALAASYITSSVLQELLGVGSHLEGFFLRIDLDRLEVIRQKLTRLARCPACALERPNLRHPFL